MKIGLKRISGCLCFVLFAYAASIALLRGSCFFELNPLIVLTGCAVIAFAAYKVGHGKTAVKRSTSIIRTSIILSACVLYFILQLWLANVFQISFNYPAWDFSIVARSAAMKVIFGIDAASSYEEYYCLFPNNAPLYFVITGVMTFLKNIGIKSVAYGACVFNVLMIDLSIMFSSFAAAKIAGKRCAGICALLLSFLTLPILGYSAIYYTDTLTMLFPVLTLFLWTTVRDGKTDRVQSAVILALMSGICALGAQLKISVAIALVAVIIDVILSRCFKEAVCCILIIVLVFTAVYLPLSNAVKNSPEMPHTDKYGTVPKVHWIMMGLYANGNYHDPDYQLTLSFPSEQREEMVIDEIGKRISEYGFTGMLKHLDSKMEFIYGDGSYFVTMKLERDRQNDSFLDNWIKWDGEKTLYTSYMYQFLYLLMWICVSLSGFLCMIKKETGIKLLPFSLACLGLMMFEWIWEARSRYLFNFIPVTITIAAVILSNDLNIIKSRSEKVSVDE